MPNQSPAAAPSAWTACSEKCQGYFVSSCESTQHAPLELQACHDCERFIGECGAVDDGAAAVQFVRDLEDGKPHAIAMARELLP